MGGLAFAHIRPVDDHDDLSGFSSGCAETDGWLERHAARAVRSGTARLYVLPLKDGSICGFYTLSAHAIARSSDLVRQLRRNSPDPIPCTLLGQLAVDSRYQGQSAGARLLQDAIVRAQKASSAVASKALVVDPIDENAEQFYSHFGFAFLSRESHRMFLPL